MGAVIIVGAGPTGLMLAIELGRRGVPTLVVSDLMTTSDSPKATVTQARTMEHFRAVGLAERVRSTGTPAANPTDIVYCSRISWHELARHRLPSPAEACRWVREAPDTWHTPELTHRSAQMWIEPILLDKARSFASVEIVLGWRVVSYTDHGSRVTVTATRDGEVRTFDGDYVVGCDGAGSVVRAQMGIERGDSSAITEFKGRPMFSVHARAPKFFDAVPFARGWLYAAVNATQRGSCISLDGAEFKFSFWRPAEWTGDTVTRQQIADIHQRMFGRELEFEVLGYKFWRGGAASVADGYRRGRAVLAGDAAHLFTPSAGLGYCTGIDDVANLGWKLAAIVQGWGGPLLLDSYERERRPEAMRRTAFAAECAERLALFKPSDELEQDTAAGDRARAAARAHFASHLPFQYDIPGINFGARYDGSPVIATEPGTPPSQSANSYAPTARPGGRAPHAWLSDGRSLYDELGHGLTVLEFAAGAGDALVAAATPLGIPMTIARVPALRERYEANVAVVRPDHIVAWRGSGNEDPSAILRTITGWG